MAKIRRMRAGARSARLSSSGAVPGDQLLRGAEKDCKAARSKADRSDGWRSARRLRQLELSFGARVTNGRRPALRRAARRSRRWKAGLQPGGLHLKQHLRVRKAGEAMGAQAAEPNAGRRRRTYRASRGSRHNDLAAVARRTDARRRVDGEA